MNPAAPVTMYRTTPEGSSDVIGDEYCPRVARTLLTAIGAVVLIMVSPASAEGPTAGSTRVTWQVQASPFRLSFFENGRPLVRQALGQPGPGTRMSYRIVKGGGMHTLTTLLRTQPTPTGAVYRVATTEGQRTATVRVSRIASGVLVEVELQPATSVVRTVYESFSVSAADHFLGTGERRDYVDLRGRIVPIKVWHNCGSAKPAPFFISSRGYGIRFVGDAVGRMAFGGVRDDPACQLGTAPCEVASARSIAQACFKTATLSYELYVGSPERIVRSYLARIGRPPLPSPEQFEVIKWRDRVETADALAEDVRTFAAYRIPLGWVLLDNPWEAGGCNGSLRFDEQRFPDPNAMIDDLHARDVKLMLWVAPIVTVVCGRALYPRRAVLGPGHEQALDLTAPDVRATFEARLREVVALGIDGVKVDRGDEVDLELMQLAAGPGANFHNAYPRILAESVMRVLRARPGRGAATIFRGGWTGSQRLVPGVWSGDLPTSFNGLENAVRSGQTAALVGYAAWGSDIGGYDGVGSIGPELLVRWAQFGALSPIFEIAGPGKHPGSLVLDRTSADGLRRAATLHYELFPYHWELARRAHRTGDPPLRPLAFTFPGDEGSWSAELETMLGPDLLAAPLTVPGTSAKVYLPPGSWTDVHTGAVVRGPGTLVRPTPLDEFPLYLRGGAAIPFEPREPRAWSHPWGRNELRRATRGGWLLGTSDAAGTTVDRGSISATRRGDVLRISLRRARRETTLLLLGRRPPRSVTVASRPLPRATIADFPRVAEGWTTVHRPYRGTLVKLAPRGGRAEVTVELR
jgi:alpha-D-xyloside xylohydrolase